MGDLRVGDRTRHGRIVGIQEETEHLRGFAWVERQCADGTVEREQVYLDELQTECGVATNSGPCTRIRGHLSPTHWHIGEATDG